jgi:hypothetical protein
MLSEQDIDSAIEGAGNRAVFTFQLKDATQNIICLCSKWYSLWGKQCERRNFLDQINDGFCCQQLDNKNKTCLCLAPAAWIPDNFVPKFKLTFATQMLIESKPTG